MASRLVQALGLACAALALSGCAWLVSLDDEVVPPWRVAEVLAVGPRSAWQQPVTLDCKPTPSRTREDAIFVVLVYHDGPRHSRQVRTARMPVVEALQVGDRVQFDTVDCLVEKIPRIL